MTTRSSYGPDIEAEISFLPTEAGGRSGAVSSDYRGDFYFGGQYYVTVHEYPGVELVNPGQTVRALLRFLRPELLGNLLNVNDPFEIREGTRTVASGRVTRVLSLGNHAAGSVP
jgi:translation elongation factor EF-Tu-like GTPase